MTTRKYSSRSQQSTLTGAITSGATSMTVVSGTALLGGVTIPAGTTFTLVIDVDTALEEIVDATAVSTNTFTITRAIDGSSAQDHSAGAVVRHMAIGRDYRDSNLHAEASAYYNDGSGSGHSMHGIGSGEGDVVGTLKTQTLTNKTLTSPTITDPTITGTASAGAVLVFEGATADAYETTLTVVDPTQDNTVTIPNTTGTVVLDTATQTLTNKTLTSPVLSGTPVITGLSSAGMVSSSATPKDYVDSILGSATAAATSAASAATSAASAATSATSAANSATASATSASAAATSATSAATSATSAAASATAAATSATSAAASATTASNSAAAAATSATSASNSATASATSASAAATSATSAAASATSAANSASAAATSATSAAASATAAATSAASAATSATSAAASAASAAAVLAGAIQATIFDAKGDLLAASAADTPVRLAAASTNGYVLSVNSATASGLEWIAPQTGDITGVTAGDGLTGGGTSGDVTLAVSSDVLRTTGGQVISANTSANALEIRQTGAGNALVVEDSANPDASPTVIDASGNIITGYTSALSASGYSGLSTAPRLQVQGTSGAGSALGLSNWANNAASAGAFIINKSKSGTIGTYGATTTGDDVGALVFNADDGTEFLRSSMVFAEVDGAVSTGIVPGRLGFYTTSTAGTLTERMRIDSAGQVGIGATPTTGVNLRVGKNITGNATAFGIYSNPIIQSDVTTAQINSTFPSIIDSAFTLGSLSHYLAAQGTKGASATITNQYGFRVEGSLTGATNNYGFFSNLASASNVWNFYALGSAANFFAGRVGIGATLTSGAMAQVTNTTASDIGFVVKGAASQTGHLFDVMNSAGTELFWIDSSGTPRMQNPFILRADTSAEGGQINFARASDNASAWSLDVNGSTSTPSFRIIDNIAAASRLVIDSSGNVGIGTATGTAKLDVSGAIRATSVSSITSGAGLELSYGGTANTADILAYDRTASAFKNLELRANNIIFNTGGGGERARIDSSGNTTINSIAAGTTSTAAVGGGYMGLPQNSTTTGAYTVVAADAGKHIYSTATRTVTIDSNANLALPVGTTLTFIAGSGATVTIAITTDTMYLAGAGTTGSRTLAAFGMATAVKIASTTWIISGNGLT